MLSVHFIVLYFSELAYYSLNDWHLWVQNQDIAGTIRPHRCKP